MEISGEIFFQKIKKAKSTVEQATFPFLVDDLN